MKENSNLIMKVLRDRRDKAARNIDAAGAWNYHQMGSERDLLAQINAEIARRIARSDA